MTTPPLQEQKPVWSAVLEVQDPDGTRTRHPFTHPRMAVGRERDNDLSLADERVSHRHCEFISEQGFFVVRDLRSQNGTFVNGRRVIDLRLRDNDEVRIGQTRIRILLEGNVRVPERRSRGRALGVVLGLAVMGVSWLWLSQKQREQQSAYAGLVREQIGGGCRTPRFAELRAVDEKIAGRTFALTRERGAVRLSRGDEALDRELLELQQRKLALVHEAFAALVAAQESRRQAMEKLARAGQQLWTARGRKTAAFIDGLLGERAQAVDELAQSLRLYGDDTAQLTSTVAALLAPQPDPQAAEHLTAIRFRVDLPKARAACEEKDARVSAGLAGAATALSE
jgi:pSer/pThr/pTyr-binding forkhead associated (FHA) protein